MYAIRSYYEVNPWRSLNRGNLLQCRPRVIPRPIPMTAPLSFRLRRRALSALALAALTLTSACSGAFVDRRRDAGHQEPTYVGDSKPDAPSICYNSWTATPAQVRALAEKICA